MANVFLTTDDVKRLLIESAREEVAKLPLASCKDLLKTKNIHPGIGGALVISLMIAAKERIEKECKK